MQYRSPTLDQLDCLEHFLRRSAREVFEAEVGDGRVIDDFTFVYDRYPRYGRLHDLHGLALVLGDRFFRMATIAKGFLAATQLGHDPEGILGEPAILEMPLLDAVEMSEDELEEYLERLAAVVHRIDPALVIEVDSMDLLLANGPLVTPRLDMPAVRSIAAGETGTIALRDIGVTKVALVTTEHGLAVDVEGERTPVSLSEANVFLNTSDEGSWRGHLDLM